MIRRGAFFLLALSGVCAGCAGGSTAFGGPPPRSGASGSPTAGPTAQQSATPPPGATTTPSPSPVPTATGSFAPLDQMGPPLDVPVATLAANLTCPRRLAGVTRTPVLLVPGTNTVPTVAYAWNYERAFTAAGIPWCAVTLPFSATGDIQTAGEYLVYAIRTMSAAAGRKIDILGWSQGGMVPRWAFRFWPDTRGLVVALAGLDPSNHGTLDTDAICQGTCSPADWQQASSSHFIAALNSGAETFAGINYTNVYSITDEIVTPNLPPDSSSSLSTGAGAIANIYVQQICPADVSEHIAMGTYDPVGYALAVDAFSHAGVANPSRIPASVCSELYQPGVDPSTFAQDYAALLAYVGEEQVAAPMVPAEPALAPYVTATP